jgi:hypothetical protein
VSVIDTGYSMVARFLLGLVFPATLVATSALADDKAACLDAAAKGQRLRATHKLVEAREELRVCALATCPAVVQSDCANWLDSVERTLPTVVVTAKDGTGLDLVDVRVSVDGALLAPRIDGLAVPMNAGLHVFHFESSGRPALDRDVLVKEGEKNQEVGVVLGPSVAAPSSTASSAEVSGGPSGSGWGESIGWGIGGVGVVGLLVGAVAGLVAVADKGSAHCDAHDVCDRGSVDAIKNAALVSDVGWVAGGVLLVGGAGLLLFAHETRTSNTGLRVVPVVVPSGGAIVARASW